MSQRTFTPRSDAVSLGTEHPVRLQITTPGCDTFGPPVVFIAAFSMILGAQKDRYGLHRDSGAGQRRAT